MAALDKEMMLLVIQYLGDENLKETMHKMEQESGLFFNMKYFEEKILAGDWDETEKYLGGFTKINENRYTMKIFFEIRKQKYFEALDRQDKVTAVSILVKDLKIFSTFNEELYKEIAHLITLDNFRENEQLASYGDTNSSRAILMSELKKLIEVNPSFKDKLMFPSFSLSRLRYLINQGLNWQHQLCRNPKPNPDIKTLLIDHNCSSPRKHGPRMPTLAMPPAADAANYPSYLIAPFSPALAAPTANAIAAFPVNANPSSSSQSPAVIAAPTANAVAAFPMNANPSSSSQSPSVIAAPTANAVAAFPVNGNPSSYSQSPAVIAAPTANAVAAFSVNGNPSSSSQSPAVIAAPTANAVAAFPVNGNPSSSSQSPAVIAAPTANAVAAFPMNANPSSSSKSPSVIAASTANAVASFPVNGNPSSSSQSPAVIAAPTANSVAAFSMNGNPSSSSQSPSVIAAPTANAVAAFPMNGNPSSSSQSPSVIAVPTANAVAAFPVNGNPSSSSQSPAVIASPTANAVAAFPMNGNPSSSSQPPSVIAAPTANAVVAFPVYGNPSSSSQPPFVIAAPTAIAVAAFPVNGNPSSSSQSPAEIAASSVPGPSTQETLNTLALMVHQSNNHDQQMRDSQPSEEPVQAPHTYKPKPVNRLFDQLPRTVVCKLHQGSTVTSMEFHPFIHSILAVGSANGEVSLWEASLRERLISKPFKIWNISNCSVKFQALNLKESTIPINRVSWSPNAALVGIAYAKHLVHLYTYQIPNGLLEHLEIDAHDGAVNDLSFSYPNSQLCVVTCGDDMLIKVWDLDGHTIFIFEGHGAPVYSVLPRAKENIQFILSTSVDGKIRAWVYNDKNFQLEYDTPGQYCTTLIYNADGTRLFSCGASKEGECFLVEWNEAEGAIEKTYSGFKNKSAGIVQFDVVKNRFLAVGVDNQIKFWDMDRVNVLTSTDAEGGLPSLPHLKLNKEGNMIAVTTDDGGIKILASADSIKYLRDIEASKERIDPKNGLIVHPVQYRIVTIPENMGEGNKVVRLLYSNNGIALLALGSKGIQKLWKWIPNALNPLGKATARFVPKQYKPSNGILMNNDVPNNCDSAIPCLGLSNNDSYAVSACGGIIALFNLVSFRVMTSFMQPPPAATFLAFNPEDNNIVLIGREDSEIHVFNVRFHELTSVLKGHQQYITGIAFSLRLNTMVSSSADAQLLSWSMDKWVKKKSVSIQMPGGGNVLSGETKIQFHIDEVKLLVCHETQIAIYDASQMELICQWLPQDGLSGAITSAAYSCNGDLVYATFIDGNIGIFDAESLQLRTQIGSSAYLYQTPSSSQNVYPLVVAAHPENPYQFAIGLSDGYVKVIEPSDSAGWLEQKVTAVKMDIM